MKYENMRYLTSQTSLTDVNYRNYNGQGLTTLGPTKLYGAELREPLINIIWYDTMQFSQTHYLANGLSDHTPMLIQFPSTPRPKVTFQFYDMWYMHREFGLIVKSTIPSGSSHTSKMLQVNRFLNHLKPLLSRLNKHYFSNLKAQQAKAKLELCTSHQSLQ